MCVCVCVSCAEVQLCVLIATLSPPQFMKMFVQFIVPGSGAARAPAQPTGFPALQQGSPPPGPEGPVILEVTDENKAKASVIQRLR